MRVERAKMQSGQMGNKKFEGEDGVSAALAEEGRLNGGGIQAGGIGGGSHSAISRRSREAASRVRAAMSSEFKGE